MKKNFLMLIIVVALAYIGYKYVYHDHRNISEESPEYQVTSHSLLSEFSSNASEAEKKYLNKTIAVSGPVSSSSPLSISLNQSIFCQFMDSLKILPKNGETIKIKGRFIGYDDLLEEIKLDQSSIFNK